MFKIVDGPIEDIELEDAVRTDADGAVIVFRGVARRFSRGRDVVHLEYEAYPEIGEASVAIAVSAPHRGEAFAACQYAIDRLKQIVPIWKKEVWSDGAQWIGWEHEAHAQESVASEK